MSSRRPLKSEKSGKLEYIPGCDGPVHVGVLLDGRPAEQGNLAKAGAIPRDNLAVWRRYLTVDVPLVDLARWGHQQAGVPWEGDRRLQCAGP